MRRLTSAPSALPRTWGINRPITLPRSRGSSGTRPLSHDLADQSDDLVLAQLRRQVLLQHGQVKGFLVGQLGAAPVAEGLDAVPAVVDLLRHDLDHGRVVEGFPPLLLHGLHREFEEPQRVHPRLLALPHGVLDVILEPVSQRHDRHPPAAGWSVPDCRPSILNPAAPVREPAGFTINRYVLPQHSQPSRHSDPRGSVPFFQRLSRDSNRLSVERNRSKSVRPRPSTTVYRPASAGITVDSNPQQMTEPSLLTPQALMPAVSTEINSPAGGAVWSGAS